MEKFYTCRQVADYYGVKIKTVWNWVRLKKIKAVKIGKSYRFREADLLAFENGEVPSDE